MSKKHSDEFKLLDDSFKVVVNTAAEQKKSCCVIISDDDYDTENLATSVYAAGNPVNIALGMLEIISENPALKIIITAKLLDEKFMSRIGGKQ